MADPIRLTEIYLTAGIPEHTFVPPRHYARLVAALEQRAGGVIVEGPSGIGKTVAISKAIEQLPPNFGIPARERLSARNPSDLPAIQRLLNDRPDGLWLIDDVHLLDGTTRTNLADTIKYLADQRDPRCKIVLIGINNAGENLIQRSSDLLSRLTVIPFESNPDESVERLIKLGEEWLNISIPDHARLVSEARGSFYLAQLLCRRACEEASLFEEHPSNQPPKRLDVDIEHVVNEVISEFTGSFYDIAREFARGKSPKRRGRAPYLQCLRWLAEGTEWSIKLDQSAEASPKYHASVVQILKKGYLADHIGSSEDLRRMLHFDNESKSLSLNDPRFVFYLRHIDWEEFRQQVGFAPESTTDYDFALSFAAPQRELARRLFDKLTESDFAVFFDEVERPRMLAQDVRTYLAPIYASGAQYILVLLGKDYPRKYWTGFEQDQYQERIAKGAVIPIWTPAEAPTYADELTSRGGIAFTQERPTDDEISRVVEDLARKLELAPSV